MIKYIYQYPSWPNFTWDEKEIQVILGKVRYMQGKLLGQMSSLGFSIKEQTHLSNLTLDVLKSSEIEGEKLNEDQVRSSIARRLGMEYAGMIPSGRDVEGVVEMMLDATQKCKLPLDEDRLFGWHAALFPTGRSGMYKIVTGRYRDGEMQVVSGPLGKEKVHYHAPSPEMVKEEMDRFLEWFNGETKLDPVIKVAIAHFWFIIIHPFDDGNGRIARALSDMLLSRSDEAPHRYYSMSSQILIERKQYYDMLQQSQHGDGEITGWLDWFLNCLYRSLESSQELILKVLHKSLFWDNHKETDLNTRQRLMLSKLLDGIDGKLKSSKWAKMAKCSADTALRDIKDLIEKGILEQEESGGRSTNYKLVDF